MKSTDGHETNKVNQTYNKYLAWELDPNSPPTLTQVKNLT